MQKTVDNKWKIGIIKTTTMRHIDSGKPVTSEEADLLGASYTFTDSFGKDVRVSQPVPERHTNHDGIPQIPVVRANVGFAVTNYDSRYPGRKDGTIVYECSQFHEKINSPVKEERRNYTLVTVVQYGNDDNYTLTYYDKPGNF